MLGFLYMHKTYPMAVALMEVRKWVLITVTWYECLKSLYELNIDIREHELFHRKQWKIVSKAFTEF